MKPGLRTVTPGDPRSLSGQGSHQTQQQCEIVRGTWFLEYPFGGSRLLTGSQDYFTGTSVIRKLNTTDQPRNWKVFREAELSVEWRQPHQHSEMLKGRNLVKSSVQGMPRAKCISDTWPPILPNLTAVLHSHMGLLGYSPFSSFHLPVDHSLGHTKSQIPRWVYYNATRLLSMTSVEPCTE